MKKYLENFHTHPKEDQRVRALAIEKGIQPDVVKVKLTKSIVDKNQIKLIISGVETFSIH